MYQLILLLATIIKTECASYYNSRYDTTDGYPSSTSSSPYKSVSYGSDIANFPEGTRYPSSYSPGYGYTTPGYSSYSSTAYPGSYGSYSTSRSNSLYGSGSSSYNQGSNRYGSGYGTGSTYGTGSNYGSGSTYGTGSNYGSGSTYGTGSNYGLGSSYGTGSNYGSGSTYGTGSNYRSGPTLGSGSTYRSGYASNYGNYGTGSTLGGYSSYEAPFMNNLGSCANRSPQTGIWVDNLMGMWYGVEYFQHLGTDTNIDYTYNSYWQTCIVIHISEPKDRPYTENQLFHVQHINAKFRQDYRHLRLLWDEGGHTSEYALYFRNDTAGYWHVYDRQNGTLTSMPSYQQFAGTVQVLKAVNDHMVLNFCQEGTNFRSPQLYTVLFSRNPGELSRWEIDSVHNMLQNKKLSIASRRMVCGNSSAHKFIYSLSLSVLMCVLAFILRTS